MSTINVGVKAGNSNTGVTEAKDIVKAIKAGAAALLMKKGAPGAAAITIKSETVNGTLQFHGQPSEGSGRLMYYVEGTVDMGPLKGLKFGGTVQLPKEDLGNYIDDDSLKLFQAAKTAAKGGKESEKLTPAQVALLAEHGVTVSKK